MVYLDKYDVPEEVKENVKSYFEKKLPYYSVLTVSRHSDHPDDDYLYHVIGQHRNGSYACWTSWNQITGSLNFGHYGLESKEEAETVSDNYYYMTTPIKKTHTR